MRVAAQAGGPRGLAAYVIPVIAAFGAFYLIGHKLGLSIGPEVTLFGFQVALLGDLAIGLAAALARGLPAGRRRACEAPIDGRPGLVAG